MNCSIWKASAVLAALGGLLASPMTQWTLAAKPAKGGKNLVETNPTDTVMGNWKGTYTTGNGDSGAVEAKIIGRGNGKYDGSLIVPNPNDSEGKPFVVPVTGKGEATDSNSKATFTGSFKLPDEFAGNGTLTFDVANGKANGSFKADNANGTFELTRYTYKSKTLGAKPPEGAVVLFDGKDLKQWKMRGANADPFWKLTDQGAVQVHRAELDGKMLKGSLVSIPTFTDAKIHVEFRTPYMPFATGQARGNSGVYVQGRYEVQVLDSFGLPPKDNEAGGIYKASVPKLNAALPPGEWQTYDITFHAPKFDENKKKIKDATISVVYNDQLIHDNITLPAPTPGGTGGDVSTPGGLLFQDHGNPVQYRNVWFMPLNETK